MAGLAIGESLTYINWTVLSALPVGSFGAVVLLGLRTDATRGFLGFTAFCSAALAGLTLLADTALPDPGSTLVIVASPALDLPRRAALAALVVLALAYVVALARNRRAPFVGIAGVVAGVAALAIAAYGWGGGLARWIPLAVQLVVLAAALGGVLAAMILGHWYLVTPRLSEGPLVVLARADLGGGGAAGAVRGLDVDRCRRRSPAVRAAGRSVGAVRLAAAPHRARVPRRSDVGCAADGAEPLHGVGDRAALLLYVDVGAIAAGTILAAGLYFGAGLLV